MEGTRLSAFDDDSRAWAPASGSGPGDGGNIALFRTADDRVFALLDRCPHKGGPLSQGIVYGDRVACPLHNWTIELDYGLRGGARPRLRATRRGARRRGDGRWIGDSG